MTLEGYPPDAPPPDDSGADTASSLEDVIREASAYLERTVSAPDARGPAKSPVAAVPASMAAIWRRAVWILFAVAAVSAGAVMVVPLGVSADPERVEEDLRWSVAELAEAVHHHRIRMGSLPSPAQVGPWTSAFVRFLPGTDGSFTVVGRRDDVSSTYVSSLDLEAWREGRLVPADDGEDETPDADPPPQ